jgi:hypothetical protein
VISVNGSTAAASSSARNTRMVAGSTSGASRGSMMISSPMSSSAQDGANVTIGATGLNCRGSDAWPSDAT